ncbi:MAG: VOC family protein [Pseudomonadota bacterium]
MDEKGFHPRALGEIAIRCADIDAMARFYEDVIGLKRLSGNAGSDIVFFKVSEGFEGHTSVLALFRHNARQRDVHPVGSDAPATGAGSSLHHLALSLPYSEQDAVMAWYEKLGLEYSVQHFPWIGWRGIFTRDPEGNTVELVAFDRSELGS